MLNIILSGCNGKMGHVISNLVSLSEDSKIACGIDIAKGNPEFKYSDNTRIEVRPVMTKETHTGFVYPSETI